MQKKSQNKQTLIYNKETIFDIVQFGSSILKNSNPNDIDIAVIFKKIPLKEQLEEAQKIKRQLEPKFEKPIHITSYDLYSLFDEGNFAKENILFSGRSLISGDYFSLKFGLNPKIQIYYSLKELKKKDKIRFNYLLNGKGGKYGLLKESEGKLLKPGLIEIKPEYEKIFIEEMKKITDKLEVKKVLVNQ